jgi:hypothetical protein
MSLGMRESGGEVRPAMVPGGPSEAFRRAAEELRQASDQGVCPVRPRLGAEVADGPVPGAPPFSLPVHPSFGTLPACH